MYGSAEVELHAFLSSALDRDMWGAWSFGCFTPFWDAGCGSYNWRLASNVVGSVSVAVMRCIQQPAQWQQTQSLDGVHPTACAVTTNTESGRSASNSLCSDNKHRVWTECIQQPAQWQQAQSLDGVHPTACAVTTSTESGRSACNYQNVVYVRPWTLPHLTAV
jgi:hypothetical protein